MIDAVILLRDGERVGFRISGHSGYAAAGRDIVCSAVSALAQTTVLSLSEIVGIESDCEINENGSLFCLVHQCDDIKKRDNACLLIDSLHIGLVSIEQEYGKFLRVSEREVTSNV